MRARWTSVDRALLWLGIAVWGATVGLTALSIGLSVVSPAPPFPNRFGMTDAAMGGFWVLEIACVTVALAIVTRLPRNLVAWILFGIGLGYAVSMIGAAYLFDAAARADLVGLPVVAWVTQAGAQAAGVLTFIFIFVYPGLSTTSRPMRLVVVVASWWIALSILLVLLHPGALFFWPSIDNPFGIGPRLGLDDEGNLAILSPLLGIGGLLACAWIAWRYRRSQGIERLQFKWFVSAAMVSLAALVVLVTISATGRASRTDWWPLLVYALSVMLVPIAVGIAILRYDLYAIDRLINRALVYGAATGLLVVLYAAMVVVASQALAGLTNQGATFAVAVSTLTVAALFNPVRRRIQTAVDRRFYRSKYDATRTVDAFGERLRRTLDLDELEIEMLEVVARTVQPVNAGMWLHDAAKTEMRYRQAVRA